MNSLLWEIKCDANAKSSYIFGTIHIQDSRVFSFDNIVTDCIDACDAFAMEAIPEDADRNTMLDIFYMKRRTLKGLLGEKYYDMLGYLLNNRFGMNIGMFEKTKPMFIAVQLMQFYEIKDMSDPLDIYLMNIAKNKNKKIVGLESAKEQLSAVKKITLKEQSFMLKELLKDSESIEEKFNLLLSAYLRADFRAINRITRDRAFSINSREALIYGRNRKMALRIERIAQSQSVFAAVGAGHLTGKDGLVSLLENRGIKMKAIKFNYKI